MDLSFNKQYLLSFSLKDDDGIYNLVFNYILCPQLTISYGTIVPFSSYLCLCLAWPGLLSTCHLQGQTVFYSSIYLQQSVCPK